MEIEDVRVGNDALEEIRVRLFRGLRRLQARGYYRSVETGEVRAGKVLTFDFLHLDEADTLALRAMLILFGEMAADLEAALEGQP